jgi:ribulose-5-phosphate 4-epimerase/fuculose-1-phosphate aldolase
MNLQNVLKLVDGFHITDKKLLRARQALDRHHGPAAVETFRKEAVRYFSMLEREAQAHVKSADQRLDDLYQRQYNLQAERAVAERRRDSAHALLEALAP